MGRISLTHIFAFKVNVKDFTSLTNFKTLMLASSIFCYSSLTVVAQAFGLYTLAVSCRQKSLVKFFFNMYKKYLFQANMFKQSASQ